MDNRLREVISDIIDPNQTGFVSGRNITKNIRKSLDVMEYCRATKTPAVIMSVDMEKCFDKIEYKAIFGALRIYNFGETFIKWVSLFFNHITVCTQNCGYHAPWFEKSRSVNQGCNISPSLYLLVGQLLTSLIKNHKEINGIKIGETEMLISQFADDTDLYLPFDKIVLNAVIECFQCIETSTGLTVSYEKTTLYRIGSIADSNAKFYTTKSLKWSNEAINTIGVALHKMELERNFDNIQHKMNTVTKMWWYRKVTLLGKVLIVNALIASLFVYKFQVIHYISEARYQKAEEMIEKFIWNDKKPKIKLNILMLSKENGGLGLVNLRLKHQALIMGWIKKCKYDEILYKLAQHFLKGKFELLCRANLNQKDFASIRQSDGFWWETMARWCTANFHQPQNQELVLQQSLWYNSMIKIDDKVVYYEDAYRAGITTIESIWSGNKFIEYKEFTDMFGNTINWLQYQALISAIPEYWKYLLEKENLNDEWVPANDLLDSKRFSYVMYKRINDSQNGIQASATKWF